MGTLRRNGDVEDEDEDEGLGGGGTVEIVVGQNIQLSGSCCDRVT